MSKQFSHNQCPHCGTEITSSFTIRQHIEESGECDNNVLQYIKIRDDQCIWAIYTKLWEDIQRPLCVSIARAWINLITPQKRLQHSYNGGEAPGWWPKEVQYQKPANIRIGDLATLLSHILRMVMLPHDKQHNDIQKDSVVISKLKEVAFSSRGAVTARSNNTRKTSYLETLFKLAEFEEVYKHGKINTDTKVTVTSTVFGCIITCDLEGEQISTVMESQDKHGSVIAGPRRSSSECDEGRAVKKQRAISVCSSQHLLGDDTVSSTGVVSSPTPVDNPISKLDRGKACIPCRRRRVRCDGAKPDCGPCIALGVSCGVKNKSFEVQLLSLQQLLTELQQNSQWLLYFHQENTSQRPSNDDNGILGDTKIYSGLDPSPLIRDAVSLPDPIKLCRSCMYSAYREEFDKHHRDTGHTANREVCCQCFVIYDISTKHTCTSILDAKPHIAKAIAEGAQKLVFLNTRSDILQARLEQQREQMELLQTSMQAQLKDMEKSLLQVQAKNTESISPANASPSQAVWGRMNVRDAQDMMENTERPEYLCGLHVSNNETNEIFHDELRLNRWWPGDSAAGLNGIPIDYQFASHEPGAFID